MSNRTLFNLSILMLVCIGALIIVNLSPFFLHRIPDKYISPREVQSIAVVYQNKPYTLNFDQQNQFLTYVNSAIKVAKDRFIGDLNKSHFERVILYRIGQPEITLDPAGITKENNLLWTVKEWNPDGYLLEQSDGKLLKLLNNAYDQLPESKES